MLKVDDYKFGSITINGKNYRYDVMVNKGKIEARNKIGTEEYPGHAPLVASENIPWDCKELIIGTGMNGVMRVDPNIIKKAKDLKIKLIILPTTKAIEKFNQADQSKTNAVFHLTC